jgi:hypothetical protein
MLVEQRRYLIVIGALMPDGRLELQPTYLSQSAEFAEEDPESPLVAELVDERGGVLLRHHVPVGPFCADGVTPETRAVMGKVPFLEGTRIVRLLDGEREVQRLEVPGAEPVVRINWEPGQRVEGRQLLTWEGDHPEGRDLHYMVCYSNTDGVDWHFLSFTILEPAYEVDFDRLPGGASCQVGVVASDGVNTVLTTTPSFPVPIKPCQALILAPEEGTTVSAGAPITLQGQGYYLEEREPELEQLDWSSSVDGTLGTGPVLDVALSPGTHQITLRAGTPERRGEATVGVTASQRSSSP